MEQVIDWLNEHELRSFPFMDGSNKVLGSGLIFIQLPDNFLLDLQIVTSTELTQDYTLASGATATVPKPVNLTKLFKTQAGNIVVEFSAGSTLIASFTIPATALNHTPIYVRTAEGLAVFGEGVKVIDNLATTGNNYTGAVVVEPATYHQFNKAWLGVNAIELSPEKNTEIGGYVPVQPLEETTVQNKANLVGDVQFLAGYNFRVAISDELIDLEIGFGLGLKMDCTTSFLNPEYLDCSDIVSYINGVPPDTAGNFLLKSGADISITKGATLSNFDDSYEETANSHTLFVGLPFQSGDICNPVAIKPSLI